MKKVFLLKRALRLVFDLVFPISCLGCGKEGVWICSDCQAAVSAFPGKDAGRIKISGIDEIIIATSYENELIQKAVHLLKYKSIASLAEPLAQIILRNTGIKSMEKNSLFVSVPLHKQRRRERGFNQSELIAKHLADAEGWETGNSVLVRKRHTAPQMKLDREDRLQNLKDAFVLNKSVVNKNIVLVDDVLTTGGTLKECAQTLRAGRPRKITAVVVAHGK